MESFVQTCKNAATEGMEMFLRNFSYVPDDKLNWSPTPTAKSALRVAAHTALYAGRFARMIRERAVPVVTDLAAWEAQVASEELMITTREEVERVFRAGTDEVLSALDTVTPEDLESTLDSGQGWSMPMRFVVALPGWHATLHTGQIDFIQTCYGDQEIYVK